MQLLRAAALTGVVLVWPAIVHAQQSIDYASVSGRVVDASGAVIPEAQVDARHVRTNVSSRAVTDRAGRFRFPYLRIGPYEISVHRDGFTDAKFQLTLTVGAAFELPVTLTVGPLDANVTVSAPATMLESARSQVAATVSETELRDVPLNGRQLPRHRTARARRRACQRGRHAALPRDVGRAGHQPVGQQPAQPLEQLHRGWFVGERRCRRAERDGVRRRQPRRVPGRHVGRPGGARPRAGRLRQRRDEERDEHAARHRVRLHARRPAERGQRALGREAADEPGAVWRQRRRSGGGQPHLLLRERRASRPRSDGPRDDSRRQRTGGERPARDRWIPGAAGHDRRVPEPGRHDQHARQGRPPGERPRAVRRPIQPLRRRRAQRAGGRRPQRAECLVGSRQHGSDDRVQQHPHAVRRAPCSRRVRRPPTRAWTLLRPIRSVRP